jgi:hypothetical protein
LNYYYIFKNKYKEKSSLKFANMYKGFVLAIFTLVTVVHATNYIHIYNDAGTETTIYDGCNERVCVCLENTQSAKICGDNGGTIKLFSSTDCSGSYGTLGSNSCTTGAQWVNSISFGPGTGSSKDTSGCPNFFTTSVYNTCP